MEETLVIYGSNGDGINYVTLMTSAICRGDCDYLWGTLIST